MIRHRLMSMPKDLFLSLILKLNNIFKDHVNHIETEVCTHDVMQKRL